MRNTAMILAAGMGTRLKPWTDFHPKALVPVEGVPMLERVIKRLIANGFERIVVNVHHFADQIKAFLQDKDYGVEILISDESDRLLDTGGGILHASPLFPSETPVLVHNVDILSNAPLKEIYAEHRSTLPDATLIVSHRDSSRKLAVSRNRLQGWTNLTTGATIPSGFPLTDKDLVAFSGIYVLSPSAIDNMRSCGKQSFPIMDFFLTHLRLNILCKEVPGLRILDIGKPASLAQAPEFLHDK